MFKVLSISPTQGERMILHIRSICFIAAASILLLPDQSTVTGSSYDNSHFLYRLKHFIHDKSCFVPRSVQVPIASTIEVTKPTPSPASEFANSDDGSNISNKNNNNSKDSSSGNIVGLQNLGNTCYLNAQLQCLYHIPLIRNMIAGNLDIEPRMREGSSSLSPAYSGLRQLFTDMNESQLGRAVTTASLCQLLDIPIYEQQDTQELWKLLLPALQVPDIMDLYTGTYENYITALDGSNRERRFLETFLDISLDINPSITTEDTTTGSSISISIIESLQQQFNFPELLSVAAGNGWRPSSDAPDKVDAHKGYQLTRHGLPSILQLHLKRFNFDWNTETTNKINHAVTFPLTLHLSTIVAKDDDINGKSNNNDDEVDVDHDDECVYELQSVIVHVGEYQSGHYYSYVRPNIRTDDWYRFNDEIHTRVRFTDVIVDAYGGIVTPTSSSTQQGISNSNRDGSKRNRIVRLFRSIFGMDRINANGYGFGGPKSNAYVLQYIRKTDIPKLYNIVSD